MSTGEWTVTFNSNQLDDYSTASGWIKVDLGKHETDMLLGPNDITALASILCIFEDLMAVLLGQDINILRHSNEHIRKVLSREYSHTDHIGLLNSLVCDLMNKTVYDGDEDLLNRLANIVRLRVIDHTLKTNLDG